MLNRIVVFFMLFSVILPISLAESQMKIILSDKGVLRIGQRSFLASDIKKVLKNLRAFRCVVGDSLFLSSIKLTKKNSSFDSAISLDALNKSEVKTIILLLKTMQFVHNTNEMKRFGVTDIPKNKKNCIRGLSSVDILNVAEMVGTDLFFNRRYKREINNREASYSIIMFLDSINKKISHYVFQ